MKNLQIHFSSTLAYSIAVFGLSFAFMRDVWRATEAKLSNVSALIPLISNIRLDA